MCQKTTKGRKNCQDTGLNAPKAARLFGEHWSLKQAASLTETPSSSPPPTPQAILALLDEIDRLKAENEALRSALQAVHAEVDGNIRPLTRDLVNMVSGLKNGSHPNDIYEHCDEIERIIGAALEGAKQ